MTRLYLLSGIVVGAILLQALVSRPPEILWQEPASLEKAAATGKTSSDSVTTSTTPSKTVDPPVEDVLSLARKALENAAALIPPGQSDSDTKIISTSQGTQLQIQNSEISNGKLEATLKDGVRINIPLDSISEINPFESSQDASDQTQILLNRIQSGKTIQDEELNRWIESGEAEDFALRFPHSTNRALAQILSPIDPQEKPSTTAAPSTSNVDDLESWTNSIREQISRDLPSSKRTQLVLEIDEKLAYLQKSTSLSGNREKATRWANRLRILKLDLIKSTGF